MQQEVKFRGFEGIKGIALLVLLLVGLTQGQVLAGQLVPLSLFALIGYQWAYQLERASDQPFWRHWQRVWSVWVPVVWLTAVTSVGLLVVSIPLLSQVKWDLLSSPFLIENIKQLWSQPDTVLSIQGTTGLASLWYLSLAVQLAGLVAVLIWGMSRLGWRLLYKAIAWFFLLLCLWFGAAVASMTGAPGQVVETLFYSISFVSGAVLVYLVPVILNQFYRLRLKYLLVNALGMLSGLVLLVFFISQTWDSLQMGFIWTHLMVALTTCLIFCYVAGAPLIRRCLEFPLLVGLGHRLVSYLVAYAFSSFWLGDSALWLQLAVTVLVGEISYWLFVKNRPHVYFLNGRSWLADYYALYEGISLKQVTTVELVLASFTAILLFVSVCVLGLLVIVQ